MNARDRYISEIVSDFSKVAYILSEASYEIRRRGLSEYPLFVRCVEPPRLGVCLIKISEHEAGAYYHASSLEELCQIGLISNREVFITTYKDPDQYCCLLAVDPEETEFIYLPYP